MARRQSAVGSLMVSILTFAFAASGAADGGISLQQDAGQLQVTNGLVSLVIERTSGHVTSLRLQDGPELLRTGGHIYFDANGAGPKRGRSSGYWQPSRPDVSIVRQNDELVEIAFTKVGDDYFPFRVALHYVICASEPGFYCYIVYEHDGSMPDGSIGQTRMVAKCRDDLFTHYFVSDRTQGRLPKNPDPTKPLQRVTDATVRFPNGTVATKYNLAEYEDGHYVYGLAGPAGGVWMITPSSEYVNGGPTKQNLCIHEDEAILLRMLHSGHFGGAGLSVHGEWAKLYGPFMFYLNAGGEPNALWEDAKRRAERERAQWPYTWMQHPHFPVERGTVTGKLMISDGGPAADGRIILAAPDVDWQLQGMGYLFWTHADAQGAFAIRNVRPGRYTLYAFAPGVAGEFRKDDVEVVAGHGTALGTLQWTPPAYGRCLWQVGTPDRSAGEFRCGDERRQFGLWNRYLQDFPNDVTFLIGKSRERTDWNYCQAILLKPDGTWHSPEWRILFDLPDARRGRGFLWLGIAGAVNDPVLAVSVNGQEVGQVEDLGNDSSIYREANQSGRYQLRIVEFDTALLKEGRNIVSLRLLNQVPPPGRPNPDALPRQGVMYDFVRLELAPKGPE